MNDKQKQFLSELRDLLGKYNIDVVRIRDHRTEFLSNDDKLTFSLYENGNFYNITTETGRFSPTEQSYD